MNNEANNNELNVKSNNRSKIIIAILAILLVGALGFICYDKFINKEKPPVPVNDNNDNVVEVVDEITRLNRIIISDIDQIANVLNEFHEEFVEQLHLINNLIANSGIAQVAKGKLLMIGHRVLHRQ